MGGKTPISSTMLEQFLSDMNPKPDTSSKLDINHPQRIAKHHLDHSQLDSFTNSSCKAEKKLT